MRTAGNGQRTKDIGLALALAFQLGLAFKLPARRSVYTLSMRFGLINYKSARTALKLEQSWLRRGLLLKLGLPGEVGLYNS